MDEEKFKKLQVQLAGSWKLAYDLEKESDSPELKKELSEVNGAINGIEVMLHRIEDRLKKAGG